MDPASQVVASCGIPLVYYYRRWDQPAQFTWHSMCKQVKQRPILVFFFPFLARGAEPTGQDSYFFPVAFQFHINWVALLALRIGRRGSGRGGGWQTHFHSDFRWVGGRNVIVIHDLRLE